VGCLVLIMIALVALVGLAFRAGRIPGLAVFIGASLVYAVAIALFLLCLAVAHLRIEGTADDWEPIQTEAEVGGEVPPLPGAERPRRPGMLAVPAAGLARGRRCPPTEL
jgi:hypothetical protein